MPAPQFLRLCLTRRCSLRCPPRIRTRAEVAATGVVAVLVLATAVVVAEVAEVVAVAEVPVAVVVVAVLVVAAAAVAVMMMVVVTVEAGEEVVVAAVAVEAVEVVVAAGELLPRWPSSATPCSTSAILQGPYTRPLSTPWQPSHTASGTPPASTPTASHFSLRSRSGRVSQSPPVSRQARSRFPDPERLVTRLNPVAGISG